MSQDYASRGFVTLTDHLPNWETKSADFTAVADEAYVADHATPATLLTVTLPTPSVGDVIHIATKDNAGRVAIDAPAGITIKSPIGNTTASGSYTSAEDYQAIALVAVSSSAWGVMSATGAWTVA